MEPQQEELKFEDSSEIINNRGSLRDRQANIRRRLKSKKLISQTELLKRIDVAEVRTPAIEQRAKQAQIEQQVTEILKKEGSTRSEEELAVLISFLSETMSFKAIKAEYDAPVAQQFLKLLGIGVYKSGEDIIKYCKTCHIICSLTKRVFLLHCKRTSECHVASKSAKGICDRRRLCGIQEAEQELYCARKANEAKRFCRGLTEILNDIGAT